MTISIVAGKDFNKIQHPFMIKVLQKVDLEVTYLNIKKVIYDMLTANIVLSGENLKAFPLRPGTRMSTLATLIQHSFESSSHSNQR